jgi:hypothetical protein
VSFNIQNLSDLSQSQVDQAYSLIVQMVQENDPTVDVKRGAIRSGSGEHRSSTAIE